MDACLQSLVLGVPTIPYRTYEVKLCRGVLESVEVPIGISPLFVCIRYAFVFFFLRYFFAAFCDNRENGSCVPRCTGQSRYRLHSGDVEMVLGYSTQVLTYISTIS